MLFLIAFMGRSFVAYTQVKQGYIDLSTHNFQKSNVKLTGKWQFFRTQLLTPEDIKRSSAERNPELMTVPGLWNNMQTETFKKGMGYGTYYLRFKADSQIPMLAVNFNKVQNAYKLWINDSLYAAEGIVGPDRESSQATWKSRNYTFLNQGENEIVLQVSNFYHKKGGLEHAPYVGIPSKVERNSWLILGFDHIIMGLLLIMAVYHFGLFALKRNEWSVLFFGLLTLSSVLFTMTVGEIGITYFIPNFDWEWLVKFNYISNYTRVLFFGLFIGFLFPSAFRKKLMIWVSGFVTIMVLFILVMPARIYSHSLHIFLFYAFALIAYFVGVTIQAVINKQRGALFSLIGTGILFAAVVNDVLKELLLLNSPSTATYGLFIFVLLQADMLAFRSADSFRRLNKLTDRLLTLARIKDELLTQNTMEAERPLYVIAHNINACHALAYIFIKGRWIKTAEYFSGKIISSGNEIEEIDFDNPPNNDVDFELIRSALETKRTSYRYAARTKKEIKQRGKAFSKVCMPVNKGTDIISLFYAQNIMPDKYFDEEHKLLLELLKPQLSVITQNALVFSALEQFNKELEEIVHERTEEITQQSEELRTQRDEIEEKNRVLNTATEELRIQTANISDSINYARRIQQSLFPTKEELREAFPESYIFFLPREALSGDFYWTGITQDNSKRYALMAVADATGHGVPGALMAIVGDNLISAAVYEKNMYRPADILNYIDTHLFQDLGKQESDMFDADSITLGILAWHEETRTALYAGAYQPLYINTKGELNIYKGVNRPAGIRHRTHIKKAEYFDHEILIDQGTLFLCTDGFLNQLTDEEIERFKRKDFRELLSQTAAMPFNKQADHLRLVFEKLKGRRTQTDDVLIAAINI